MKNKIQFSLTPLKTIALMDALDFVIELNKAAAFKNMGILDAKEALQVEACEDIFKQIDLQDEVMQECDFEDEMDDYKESFKLRAKNN